jgi:polyhydroxyalkanoate synthase
MSDGPLAALDVIEKVTGERRVNVLGFCIGGILVTAMLAWLAARDEDDRIASATTLATLVDFTDVGEIGVFIDREQLESLRQHVARLGYLESYHLQDMFAKLRENDLIWSFHQSNYLMGEKPRAFDLLFWNADSTHLPAAMLTWYLEKIYLENGLRRPGFLEMNGTPIDISKIRTPCFVFASKEDHIAPWPSVYPATQLFGGNTTFVLGASGHIAGVINPPAAQPKYGYWAGEEYPPEPEAWLQRAQFTKGSWWPVWGEWLEALDSDDLVDARTPGGGVLPPLEDAPGSYVLGPSRPPVEAAAAE